MRTNDSLEQRAADRARARDVRAQERIEAIASRADARVVSRDAEARARETGRDIRRAEESKTATGDPHAAAAQRRRSSGRKDVVCEQRDTRSYVTVMDVDRMRELAKRGASVAGLAGAFGISQDEVERALAQSE